MYNNNLNFPDQFFNNVTNSPNMIALTYINDKNESIDVTYKELMQKINGIGNTLLRLTQKGDRVLLLYTPGINFIAAFIACLYTNRLAIPSYPPINFSAISRLENILDNAKPALVLSEREILKKLKRFPILTICHLTA